MPLSVTIDAPASAVQNVPFSVTANVTGQDTAVSLNGGEFKIASDVTEFEISYKDGTSQIYAMSLDESGSPLITPYNDDFLYDADGELLFDANGVLLEQAQ